VERTTEIAIVSGKGGTGKTLFASSIARLAGNAVVADCDVYAPSLYLLAADVMIDWGPLAGDTIAVIDGELCSRCGKCAGACRFAAIRERESPGGWSYSVIRPSCEGCGACLEVCPDQAIRLEELRRGTWCVSNSPLGPLVHAMPETAPRRGGEIVRTLRREARKTAARLGLHHIVIDGPAGIGSTAIASVIGVSLAVVIAEPTISGLADLRRAIDLLGRLNIRMAAVINKSDLNSQIASGITGYLNGMGVEILGSIAHSDQVSRADTLGEFAVDLQGVPAAEEIKAAVGRTIALAGAVT